MKEMNCYYHTIALSTKMFKLTLHFLSDTTSKKNYVVIRSSTRKLKPYEIS